MKTPTSRTKIRRDQSGLSCHCLGSFWWETKSLDLFVTNPLFLIAGSLEKHSVSRSEDTYPESCRLRALEDVADGHVVD